MAVIVNQNQDQNQNAPSQQQGPVQTSSAGGGVAGVSSGGGPAGAAPAAPRPASSGQFTNLSRYLQANQGSGSKLASKIGENVEGQQQQTKQALGDAGVIGNQIDAEKQRIAQASGFAEQIKQDPTQLLNQQQQVQQLASGQTNAAQLQQQGQEALNRAQTGVTGLQQLGGQLGSESGRFSMLQKTLGRPTYSAGQGRLDQLLLQAEGAPALTQLQRQTNAGAQQQAQALNQQQQGFTQGLSDINSQAQAAQQNITGAITGQEKSLQDTLQGKAQQLTAQSAQETAGLQDRIRKGQLSPDDLTKLQSGLGQFNYLQGLNSDALKTIQQATGIGSSTFLGSPDEIANAVQSQNGYTASNVATQQDLARQQALMKLAGQTPEQAGFNINAADVGTAPSDLVKINPSQTGIADRYKSYQEAANPLIQSLNNYNPQQIQDQIALTQIAGSTHDTTQRAQQIQNLMNQGQLKSIDPNTIQNMISGGSNDLARDMAMNEATKSGIGGTVNQIKDLLSKYGSTDLAGSYGDKTMAIK